MCVEKKRIAPPCIDAGKVKREREKRLACLDGESLQELVLPSGSAHHHGSVAPLHHPVHGALELLALLDPDADLGHVAEARPAQKGDLLDFGQGFGVLGVDLLVIHSLCRMQFNAIKNGGKIQGMFISTIKHKH